MASRRRTLVLLLAVVVVGGLAMGQGGRDDRPPRQAATAPYLTIFLIDGLSDQVFEEELTAGRLPAIGRLIEEGRYIPHGIAAFPTMTGYGFYPLLTGRDAATSGVLGLRWFDRQRARGNFRNYVGRTNEAMNGDFHPTPATLFECFADQHSLSVNSYADRGVEHSEQAGWDYTAAKYRASHWLTRGLRRIPWAGPRLVPDWGRADSAAVQSAIDDLASRPRVQWVTLMSPDGQNHIFGTDETYRALVRQIDGLIAMYRRASDSLGQEPDRLYLVASDHGVADVATNLDLRVPLAELGLRTWRGKATFFRRAEMDRPREYWDGEDIVQAINGNTAAYLYLISDSARAAEPAIAEALRATPGVELVVRRGDDGTVLVEGANGRGTIRRQGGDLAYTVEAGVDPLGYCQAGPTAALCDGAPRSAEAWLEATHATTFPYAVPRLAALMAEPDAGDLVVTAAAGFDFGAGYELVVGSYRGGHGGIREDQIRVPYVLAGPGIAPGELQATARAEDIGALLQSLLGCAPADSGR